VVADGRVADQLADLLRVLGGDLRGDLDEHLPDELAHLVEGRHALLLGPVGQAASPELVVLVEVAHLALGEVLAAPLQPVLERGEVLVTINVDLLRLRLDRVFEVVQVLLTRLGVDRGDDRSGEVEDLLELARRDVEQVADAARDALEDPDVRDRSGEVDVAHALAAHLLPRHLDAAALADDALVADALVLAAVALPVLRRTEDAFAEEAVALGLERAVVDGLGLRDLARRPVADLLRRREADPNCVEVVDVDQVAPSSSISRSAMSTSARGPTCASASSVSSSSSETSTSSRSVRASSAGRTSSPSLSTRSWPPSASSAVGCRAAARSEPGERSMPSSSAARSSSSSSSRTSTSPPSSEMTCTSSASDCISLSSTLKLSGMDGSAMFSPFTIASYAFTRPTVSSDLIVSISWSVYAAPYACGAHTSISPE